MKKHILSIASFSVLTASALAQIPNSGFETWTNMGTYETPGSWGTMNNATTALSVYTAEKATPGVTGASYLKLTSKTFASTVVNGMAVSGKLDSLAQQPISGFSYAMQPKSFTGKWQHMVFGGSQGSVSATLTKWNTVTNSRDIIATASQTLSGMAMSWATFTINFVYQSSMVPDSCIIFLKASGSAPTNNDYLWVDDLAFAGSVVGIEEPTFLNSLVVYPNPSTDKIGLDLNFNSAQQTTIELTDVTGKVVLSENAGELNGESKQTLNVTSVAKGSYFIRIVTVSGVETKKVVIE